MSITANDDANLPFISSTCLRITLAIILMITNNI